MSTESFSGFTYPPDLAPLVDRLMGAGKFESREDLLRVALTFYDEYGDDAETEDDWPAIQASLEEVDAGAPCKPIETIMEEFAQRRSKS